MLDVSVSYNRYKFLGHEFLTWLWFIIDTDQNYIQSLQEDIISLEMNNRIVLENSFNNLTENITIKGDDAGLEEAKLSLQKGGVVTECNFSLKIGDLEWKFNIKGESLNISSLKSPETGNIEKKEDIEGVVLEKFFLYEKVVTLLNTLYTRFIAIRLQNTWNEKTVPMLKNWIQS